MGRDGAAGATPWVRRAGHFWYHEAMSDILSDRSKSLLAGILRRKDDEALHKFLARRPGLSFDADGKDARNHYGGSFLAMCRTTEATRALLEAGADPNTPGRGGRGEPLAHVATAGQVRLLVAAGARVTGGGAGLGGARSGEVVQALLDAGADANARVEDTPVLHLAMNADVVKALVGGGARVDATAGTDGQQALHAMARWSRTDALEALLAAGAAVDARDRNGCTAMHFARSHKTLAALIAAGGDVNARDGHGRTPLHLHHSREAVEVLLAAGADARALDRDGRTVLFGSEYAVAARRLIKAGADARVVTKDGSALHTTDSVAVARVLLAAGAPAHGINQYGETALFASAHKEDRTVAHTDARLAGMLPAMVALLAAHGCDAGATAQDGRTALFSAPNRATIEALILAGCDYRVRDADGRTAGEFLRRRGGDAAWLRALGEHVDTFGAARQAQQDLAARAAPARARRRA